MYTFGKMMLSLKQKPKNFLWQFSHRKILYLGDYFQGGLFIGKEEN